MSCQTDSDLYCPHDRDHQVSVEFYDELGNTKNFANYTFKAQIREEKSTTSALVADLTIDDTNKTNGVLIILLARADRNAVTVENAYWDLLGTDPNTITDNYLSGRVYFTSSVTAVS